MLLFFSKLLLNRTIFVMAVAFPRWNMISIWVMISADVYLMFVPCQDSEKQPVFDSLATVLLFTIQKYATAFFVNAYWLLLDDMMVTNVIKSFFEKGNTEMTGKKKAGWDKKRLTNIPQASLHLWQRRSQLWKFCRQQNHKVTQQGLHLTKMLLLNEIFGII